ncbi:MAG: hypothetical protein FWD81_02355 [Methanomassiliicoccaceae archaeon]|nr:hypothetical protein [Methanomassiliicoccaceae archaeon]
MTPTVRISCPVFPSEDIEKVRLAVLNIFPGAVLDITGDGIRSGSVGMDHFGDQIRRQRILDTARSVMMKGRRGEITYFDLNKQAAYAGKISFVEGRTVLGTIRVSVEADDITSFIEAFAPNTVDGEEVRI